MNLTVANPETFAEPTPAQLRRLYNSAQHLANMAPWEWMDDTQVFGVKDPHTGVIGWCVILGAIKQVYGLNVFLGDRGFSKLLEMMDDGSYGNPYLAVEMDVLVLHYNAKKEISDDERLRFKKITGSGGILIGRKKHWPWARRLQPWLYPRSISSGECELLCDALDQACNIGKRLAGNPDMELSHDDGSILVRAKEPSGAGDGWIDSWEIPGDYIRPTVEARWDYDRVKKIREKADISKETWDIDTFPVLTPVQGSDALFYPRVVIVMNKASGFVLHCEVVEPDEQDWSSVLDCLLKTMENTSLAPSVIRVRDEDLYGILNSFGDVMGFRVHRAVSMPLMDSFIGEIIESLRNDG